MDKTWFHVNPPLIHSGLHPSYMYPPMREFVERGGREGGGGGEGGRERGRERESIVANRPGSPRTHPELPYLSHPATEL